MRPIALIIGWPLIEIALFVIVGGWIGLWATLAIVLGTGVLGVSILRGAGLRSVAQVRQTVSGLQAQALPVVRGLMTALGALLLILPGFLGDAVGLVLLLPPIQVKVMQVIDARLQAAGVQMRAPRPAPAEQGTVIDGDFTEVEPGKQPTHMSSGWTRH